MEILEKYCKRCDAKKPVTEFYFNKQRLKHSTYCKIHTMEYANEYNKKHYTKKGQYGQRTKTCVVCGLTAEGKEEKDKCFGKYSNGNYKTFCNTLGCSEKWYKSAYLAKLTREGGVYNPKGESMYMTSRKTKRIRSDYRVGLIRAWFRQWCDTGVIPNAM